MKVKISLIFLIVSAIAIQCDMGHAQEVENYREIDEGEVYENKIQPPKLIMDAIGILPGMIIGEIGAGKGRFTIHLAERVKPNGFVYANDIDNESLGFLEKRIKALGLDNVSTVLGSSDDPLFKTDSLDLVIMVWTYHHLDEPVKVLSNIKKYIKPQGRIVVIDPDPKKNMGAKPSENTPIEKLKSEADQSGLELVNIFNFLKYDNIFILKIKRN